MIKGRDIELGGTVYTVPPLNLSSLERFQDRLAGYTGGIDRDNVSLIVEVAQAALARNYPDITVDQLKEVIDLGNLQEVFMAVMNVSGLQASGEVQAPVLG